jgi:hypothetical protein
MKLAPITIEQLRSWINDNKHVTWAPESRGAKVTTGRSGHFRGKYIRFNLDTTTFKINRLELSVGGDDDIIIDTKTDGEGTILDELDRVLAEDYK